MNRYLIVLTSLILFACCVSGSDISTEVFTDFNNVDDTKLLVFPTAYTHDKFKSDIQSTYIFLPHYSFGLNKRLTIGAGLPLDGRWDLFWLSSKFHLINYNSAKLAAGFFSLRSVSHFNKKFGLDVIYIVSTIKTAKSNITFGTYRIYESRERVFHLMPLYFGIIKNSGRKMYPVFELHLIPNPSYNDIKLIGGIGYRRYGLRWNFDFGVLLYPLEGKIRFGPIFTIKYNFKNKQNKPNKSLQRTAKALG